MEGMESSSNLALTWPVATSLALGAFSLCLLWLFVRRSGISFSNKRSKLPEVPAVPGCLPVVGNLLQLKEKKPYKTFSQMAEKYGPIYSIKLGSTNLIVVNNTQLAKEVMVTRFASISTRKLTSALRVLTGNKCMVAMSDYNHFHKVVKKHILENILGPKAQKRHRFHRDVMMENLSRQFGEHAKSHPNSAVNFRHVFEKELFALALKQVLGSVIQSVYVKELRGILSKDDLYKYLVVDLMECVIEVDWRDFFPYLKWVPNKKLETKIRNLHVHREVIMKALMNEQKERLKLGKEINCFYDYLMSEAKEGFSEEQMAVMLWEPLIEASDTTLITTEWAFYEIAKDKKRQERLYEEILQVCGNEKVTEEHLPKLPYLGGVFHETLRYHIPVPIVLPRYVHEDTVVGGYHIPAGSEIALNLYACNMDKQKWEKADEWMPERFVDGKYDTTNLYKTMAFGGGKRVCSGSLQAMLISCTAIGRLVQEFEWELGENEDENVDTAGLTTHRLHPLQVKVKPRKL